MAEALRDAGVGHNLSRATFLEFKMSLDGIDRELAEVAETRRSLNRRRKDLRKTMGAAGVDVEMFDRMAGDLDKPAEQRAAEQASYVRYMAWMQAPVGFQPSMDLASTDPGERAYNVHELHAIDGEGFDAGRSGRRRDSNPYRPGDEPYQRFDNAWVRGQQVAIDTLSGKGGAAGEAPKRRGRPPKGASAENGHDAAANGAATGNGHDEQPPGNDHLRTEPPPVIGDDEEATGEPPPAGD